MMPSAYIWQSDLPAGDRIFYFNNDPIAALPVIRAGARCEMRRRSCSTTIGFLRSVYNGPGNLTAP
jgi:hypothetical protein